MIGGITTYLIIYIQFYAVINTKNLPQVSKTVSNQEQTINYGSDKPEGGVNRFKGN